MTPSPSLIDTDILSALLRQDPIATNRAKSYVAAHRKLTISVITQYEILRGLRAKTAAAQIARFQRALTANTILPLTDEAIDRAASIYAHLYRQGTLIGDADILIAATALTHGLILVTNNVRHFQRVPGLIVDNWLEPPTRP
jgi:tRNA(fMet)-specific endonuclease VapC